MKRIYMCIPILSVILCVLLGGCQSASSDARQSFAQIMQDLSDGNPQTISTYFPYETLDVFPEARNRPELFKALSGTMQKTSYTIYSAEGTNKKVILNMLVSSPDNSKILKKYLDSVTATVSSKEYQEKINTFTAADYQTMAADKLIRILSEPLPVTEHTLDVTMIKTKNGWCIENSRDNILDILFVGLAKSAGAIL